METLNVSGLEKWKNRSFQILLEYLPYSVENFVASRMAWQAMPFHPNGRGPEASAPVVGAPCPLEILVCSGGTIQMPVQFGHHDYREWWRRSATPSTASTSQYLQI